MEDIRHYLNLIRKEHTRSLIVENEVDSSTKEAITGMFKTSVDETVQVDSLTNADGVVNINGVISLEINFHMVINNNDNETLCNIWFSENQIELTQAMVDIISKLYFFFQDELKKYVRENII